MANHYRRADGSFAGTWVDGTPTDDTLVEVGQPPADGRMVWNGSAWEWPAAVVKERANAPVLAEIDRREKQSLRRMRELVLKLAALNLPNDANTVALEAADSAIATERGKLVP